MDLIYNIGISAYRLAVKVASVRNRKARMMLKGQRETFKRLREQLDPAGGYIWVHAASLGEFEQGRPLIEMIKRNDPEARIVLSFFSPSGYEVRKNYQGVNAVCYLPFDLPRNVGQFLDFVKPTMAIFVKYEFWGNYLMALKRRGIPTYIVSAIFRPGQVFFRPWGGMFRAMLHCYTTIFVQNEESRQLLQNIGVRQVEVSGDTRFDRVAHICEQTKQFPTIDAFTANSPLTVVVGSSWEPDEQLIIDYFNTHEGMKLIIAPHEFDRERLLSIMARSRRAAALFSTTSPQQASQLSCLVIDSFGMLSSLYRYGQIAMVGGGFGAGIHNVNEAAVYGIPVIFGPKHAKFREANDLIACGGAFEVNGPEDFNRVMQDLCCNPAQRQRAGQIAGNYIRTHLGATQFIYDNIFPRHKRNQKNREETT